MYGRPVSAGAQEQNLVVAFALEKLPQSVCQFYIFHFQNLPRNGIRRRTGRQRLLMFFRIQQKMLGGFARLIQIMFGKLRSEIVHYLATDADSVRGEANTLLRGVLLRIVFLNSLRNGIQRKTIH
jgi:hypothetical protein